LFAVADCDIFELAFMFAESGEITETAFEFNSSVYGVFVEIV
jgi:hypothetical protein